ncbi:MAG: DNA-binding protein WhiA [Eubacteriales bacterium]|nr:DNA-binding protein WhiA [Eubacteriales bacterium]
MLSFSAKTKQELCRVSVASPCCAVAEAYGFLLFANLFSGSEIRLVTSSEEIAKRLPPLFARAFEIDIRKTETEQGKRHTFHITDRAQLDRIFHVLGYDWPRGAGCHLHRNVIEEDCCRASFLRGVFLTSGTVAGPEKKTHLELSTTHQALSREVMSLMLDMDMSPKIGTRKSLALLYFKDTESVEDFLTLIGAPLAAMAIMEGKVEKQLRNSINRTVNCEAANVIKASSAAAKQVMAIRQAMESGGEDVFPESMRETVRLRLEYPAASLNELAAQFDPPLSKPGLSYRLRRIVALAEQVNGQKKEEEL